MTMLNKSKWMQSRSHYNFHSVILTWDPLSIDRLQLTLFWWSSFAFSMSPSLIKILSTFPTIPKTHFSKESTLSTKSLKSSSSTKSESFSSFLKEICEVSLSTSLFSPRFIYKIFKSKSLCFNLQWHMWFIQNNLDIIKIFMNNNSDKHRL